VTNERFIELLDAWIGDMRRTAIDLHESGVPAERCIPLAVQIADARELGNVQRRAALNARGVNIGIPS
jgi:hypothetical protein